MDIGRGVLVRDTASTSYSTASLRTCACHERGVSARAPASKLCASGGLGAKHTAQGRAAAHKSQAVTGKTWSADVGRSIDGAEPIVERVVRPDEYMPLSEAQEIITEVVGANRPAPPRFLTFCKSGEEELRLFNYTVNGGLVGLSVFLAASQIGNPNSAAAGPSVISALKAFAQQGWEAYQYFVDAHPLLTKATISGTVYGLGDLTAQTYEGRSWSEFDPLRVLRSSLCGFLAHGPLSHFFYEKMDRFFILSKYFDGGDAWFTPLAKIAIDQTLFAATWNSLYYSMLGAMRLESPAVIAKTINSSWWEMLKAGWRVWPIVHVMTYTLVPCQDRVLWVDMVELAWVTVLSIYGQQRRERAGAAACALPGVAGEGGVFTDDILRGMTVESQVVFQSAQGEPVIKRLDEVLVEAALLEANFASSLDKATRYTNPGSSMDQAE